MLWSFRTEEFCDVIKISLPRLRDKVKSKSCCAADKGFRACTQAGKLVYLGKLMSNTRKVLGIFKFTLQEL